jgi:hypothetical protein
LIDEHISQRKNAWEKITDESYLLRNDYCQLTKVRNPKPVTFVSLALMMDVLLEKSGLRQKNHVTEGSFYKR